MNIYEQAIARIIQAQEGIIGPVAKDQAGKIAGIKIQPDGTIHIDGDGRLALSNVVKQFSDFFGHASVLVCRDAVHEINPAIPADALPDDLK